MECFDAAAAQRAKHLGFNPRLYGFTHHGRAAAEVQNGRQTLGRERVERAAEPAGFGFEHRDLDRPPGKGTRCLNPGSLRKSDLRHPACLNVTPGQRHSSIKLLAIVVLCLSLPPRCRLASTRTPFRRTRRSTRFSLGTKRGIYGSADMSSPLTSTGCYKGLRATPMSVSPTWRVGRSLAGASASESECPQPASALLASLSSDTDIPQPWRPRADWSIH